MECCQNRLNAKVSLLQLLCRRCLLCRRIGSVSQGVALLSKVCYYVVCCKVDAAYSMVPQHGHSPLAPFGRDLAWDVGIGVGLLDAQQNGAASSWRSSWRGRDVPKPIYKASTQP